MTFFKVPYAFAEDDFGRFQIGKTVFRGLAKCDRCKATTIDQANGVYDGTEPLTTLRTYRQGMVEGNKEVFFGQSLVHENYGTEISIGQFVVIE